MRKDIFRLGKDLPAWKRLVRTLQSEHGYNKLVSDLEYCVYGMEYAATREAPLRHWEFEWLALGLLVKKGLSIYRIAELMGKQYMHVRRRLAMHKIQERQMQ